MAADKESTMPGRLLIVAATAMEVRSIIDCNAAERAMGEGRWAHVECGGGVDVVVSGIGCSNASGATAWAIARGGFGAVVNVGVCGVLPGGGLGLGDVVVSTRSVFVEAGISLEGGAGDMDVLGFSLFPGQGCEGNSLTIDEGFVSSLVGCVGRGSTTGAIATVGRCSGTDEAALSVVDQTGAIVEGMEGAAVVLAGWRSGVELNGEVRVVSNTCGRRSDQAWDLEKALGVLDEVVASLAAGAGGLAAR